MTRWEVESQPNDQTSRTMPTINEPKGVDVPWDEL